MDFAVTIEPGAGVNIRKGPGTAPPGAAAASGPISFESGKEAIVFGREDSCDVVFGAEHKIVGRRHFQLLRQATGDYRIEIFGERYVGDERHALPHRRERPERRASSSADRAARLHGEDVKAEAVAFDPNATETQTPTMRTGESLKRMRRIQAVVAAGLVVVVAGVAGYFYHSEQRFASMGDVIAAVSADVQKEMVNHDYINELKAAAYAVIQRDRQGREILQGTAWPVAPGTLATNAHVAALLKGNGGDLIVRKPGSEPGGDGDFKVIDAKVNDGYADFSKFDTATKASNASYAALGNDERRTGYDVAILTVDDPDGKLGPILKRAPEDDLLGLDSGMPLAYAGYPIGGTAEQGSAQLKPTPTVQYGRITSVTDFFMFGTDPSHAYLVQHSLPTFKGASGSPIIDAKGEVVAILSGGHVVETAEGTASNAVMRNFGQRIDLIAPLLGEPSDFNLGEEEQVWQVVANRFNHFRDGVIEETKDHLKRKSGGGDVVEVTEVDGSLTGSGVEDNGYQRYVDHQVEVDGDGRYAFLVYGSEGSPLSLIVYPNGETPVADGGAASFASVDTELKSTSTVRVRVLGLTKNPAEKYTLYVYRAVPSGGQPAAALE